METGLWCCIGLLIVWNIAVCIKVYLLKKSAKEIGAEFRHLMETDTNAVIEISSRDADMCRLASDMNMALETFYRKRRCYEQGNMELKEAVTNVSHDLRTSLTAIYGYLNLLKKEPCSETVKNYLGAIENRARALKELMEELFHYTVITSETEEFTLEMLSVNGILENSIVSCYSMLKQRNIIPDISIPNKKVMRNVNEQALSRVFGNILANAVKYSDGDLNITLTETGEILFSNSAKNLTEVQVERLFDRFYTVNTARKSTGLGLSIARTLIGKMGGTISASYDKNILTVSVKL